MITVLAPCDFSKVVITDDYAEHLARKGYNRDYAGTDLARAVPGSLELRPSQLNGKVLQAHFSSIGYGNTTFVEYGGILRVRNAHQKNLGVRVGQVVNPGDSLGTMDSTGNSTGDHTHWETWLKRGGVWQNVDPINPENEIMIVNDPALLQPLEGETPEAIPAEEMPELAVMAKVRTSSLISRWINVRSLPRASSSDLGDMRPGEVWEVFKTFKDTAGNVWFGVVGPSTALGTGPSTALRSAQDGLVVGWVAAYYQGQTWVEVVNG